MDPIRAVSVPVLKAILILVILHPAAAPLAKRLDNIQLEPEERNNIPPPPPVLVVDGTVLTADQLRSVSQCHNSSNLNGTKCFVFYTSPLMSWKAAEIYCQRNLPHNGHLASVHTYSDQILIHNWVVFATTDVWIGGFRFGQNEAFMWSDETPFDFTNWGTSQPAGATGCIAVCHNQAANCTRGKWYNRNCNESIVSQFVCETGALFQEAPPQLVHQPACDPSRKCFALYKAYSTWMEANLFCETNGYTSLASVTDIVDDAIVGALIPSGFDNDIWLGGYRFGGHPFHWTDGRPFSNFTHWGPSGPAHGAGLDCLKMCHATVNCRATKWIATKCTDRNSFMCESQGNSTAAPPSVKLRR